MLRRPKRSKNKVVAPKEEEEEEVTHCVDERWTGDHWGYILRYLLLGSDDNEKPHDKIVIGEVNSPRWMSQDATSLVSRVGVINIKS
jgi:hypothetical protein